MEAFGKKLTEARTARGLDFDQVSRETNITRRYLEALEREDFSVFPGEPYLLGFLRNYCEYLGLSSSEIIASYKNIKIQESPVPLKDLMPNRPITEQLFGRRPGGKAIVWQSPAELVWRDGTSLWSLEVVLFTPKGDSYRNTLTWK